MNRSLLLVVFAFLPYSLHAAPPGPPHAVAGLNQIVSENTEVQLDGSKSSDATGESLKYQWTQLAGPEVALNGPDKVKPEFKSPLVETNSPVTLAFELAVENAQHKFDTDTIYIVVMNVNQPPIAVPGSGQTVDENVPVILDGSASQDPDGDPLQFFWTEREGPSVQVSNPRGSQAVFSSPILPESKKGSEFLTWELSVYDGEFWSTSSVSVMVTPQFRTKMKNYGLDEKADSKLQFRRNLMEKSRDTQKQAEVDAVVAREKAKAQKAFAANDDATALKSCDLILTLDPELTDTLALIKEILESQRAPVKKEWAIVREKFIQREYLDVLRHLQKIKELAPTDPTENEFQNLSLQALEKQANADFKSRVIEAHISKPEERHVDQSRTLYSQGLVLYSKGQLKQAAGAWKKAASLDRDNRLAANAYNRVVTEIKENPNADESFSE